MKVFSVKQINRQQFAHFKKVREVSHPIYGHHSLFSRKGHRFMGKELPSWKEFSSTRDPKTTIYKYSSKIDTYLFPLVGESVAPLDCQAHSQQIKGWVNRVGSVEGCLWKVLQVLLDSVEKGCRQVLPECLRVWDGKVNYCYDSWMHSSFETVYKSEQQLQNNYFSSQDLYHLSKYLSGQENYLSYVPNKESLYFRACLFVLCLGSGKLRQRNYEYAAFNLNNINIELRLQYFCNRFNHCGLGSTIRNFIKGHSSTQSFYEAVASGIKPPGNRKVLSRIRSHSNKRSKTEYCQKDCSASKIQFNCLKNSAYSEKSDLSCSQMRTLARSKTENHCKISSIEKDEKFEAGKLEAQMRVFNKPTGQQNYPLLSQKEDHFQLKQRLSELILPLTCQNLFQLLGFSEYLPQPGYESQVLDVLRGIHTKSVWVKMSSERGAIYVGDVKSEKKHGRGIYLSPTGDFYYGGWSDDRMHGYGTYIFQSGEVYEGELSCGEKHGHGKCIYPQGRQYQGPWNSNRKMGLGTVKFPNGVCFTGVFIPQKRHTYGVFVGPLDHSGKALWQNTGILQNYNWKSNQLTPNEYSKQEYLSPQNKCISPNWTRLYDETGFVYEGETKDGVREGFGIQQRQQYIYQGQWEKNKREGFGRLILRSGCCLGGEWKGNMLIRYGCQEVEDLL